MDPAYEMPILSLKINGKDTPAMFDSGAHFNAAIDEEILKKEGTSLDFANSFIDASGHVYCSKQYLVDLTIEKISFGPTKVEVYQPWGLHIGEKHTNSMNFKPVYVGAGLLKNYNILWDLGAGKMVLYPLSQAIPTNQEWEILSLNMTENGSEFYLTSNGHSITAIIDSGANISSASITRPVLTVHQKEGDELELFLRAGNFALEPLSVVVINSSQPPVDLVLGCDFLKKYKIFFDFHNKKIGISR
jgi:hypothetical protein